MYKNYDSLKKARIANDPELDKAVFAWFVKERQAGTPISGLVLSVQAQKFHNKLVLYFQCPFNN